MPTFALAATLALVPPASPTWSVAGPMVAAPRAVDAGPAVAAPAPVVRIGGSPYVVLATDVPGAWGPARSSLLVRPSSSAPEAAVGGPARSLPEALAAWKGRTVSVTGPTSRCDGTVGELMVVTRQSWMDGFESWSQDPACGTSGEACDAVIAAEVTAGNTERLLVGRIAGCGAVDEPAFVADTPVAHAREVYEGDLLARALGHFTLTDGWRREQAEYVQSGAASAPYWTVEPVVTRYELGERTFVAVSESTGGCGEDGGSVWAAWEVSTGADGEVWIDLPVQHGMPAFYPRAAADPDGDGVPTFYSYSGVAAPVEGAIREAGTWAEPWVGCAC